MSVDTLKAQASRLGAHLAEKHGVKLKHSALLEALAISYGARDWNALQAMHRPTLLSRMLGNFKSKPPVELWVTPEKLAYTFEVESYHVGFEIGATNYEVLSERNLRKNVLVYAPRGRGFRTFAEHLLSQHIAKGGGLLYLDDEGDQKSQDLLVAVADHFGRKQDCVQGNVNTLIDVSGLLAHNKIGLVALDYPKDPEKSAEVGTSLLEQLRVTLGALRYSDKHPFMVVLPSVHKYVSNRWDALWAESRSRGVMFVMRTDSVETLKRVGPGSCEILQGNTWSKVYFKPGTMLALNAAADAILAANPDILSREELCNQLVSLMPGEAFYTTPQYFKKLHTCMMTLDSP